MHKLSSKVIHMLYSRDFMRKNIVCWHRESSPWMTFWQMTSLPGYYLSKWNLHLFDQSFSPYGKQGDFRAVTKTTHMVTPSMYIQYIVGVQLLYLQPYVTWTSLQFYVMFLLSTNCWRLLSTDLLSIFLKQTYFISFKSPVLTSSAKLHQPDLNWHFNGNRSVI